VLDLLAQDELARVRVAIEALEALEALKHRAVAGMPVHGG
jgi:hypothetical protein